MFQVSLINLVAAYLIGSILILGLAWFITISLRRRRERRHRRHQVFCTYCGLVYDDPGKSDLSRCPRCSHLHERTRPSNL